MSVEVKTFLVVLLLKQNLRMVDIRCSIVLHPVLICVIPCRTCRVLRRCRIEHHLIVEEVLDLVRRAEDSEIHREKIVEGLLVDVQLGHKILIPISADYIVPVSITNGSTVVGRLRTAAEGKVMVIDDTCPGNDIRII